MKQTAFFLLGCVMAGSVAHAQSVAEKTGLNSLVGTAPTTADFVKEAAISDLFEIRSSELALQKGDADAKAFANRMVTDHTKTSDQLKAMVDDGSVKATLPTALDSSHQAKLETLTRLTGAEFERQYKEDQVSGHEDAVSLFQRYGNGGDDKTLTAWAKKTLPTLQEHLRMAKGLNAST
jgi:putative membrane protein